MLDTLTIALCPKLCRHNLSDRNVKYGVLLFSKPVFWEPQDGQNTARV